MSQIAYADPAAPRPGFGVSAAGESSDPGSDHRKARAAAAVPLAMTAGVQVIFFVSYWLPETSAVPARDWWLTQLAPLNWPLLTSAGRPQVDAQQGQWGLLGLLLLLAGLALYWLSRTRQWWGRTAMLVPAAAGLIISLGIVVSMGLRDTAAGLTVLFLIGWLVAAGYAALQGRRDRLGPVPEKGRRAGVPILAAYAVLGPLPTAVARSLFAPELRDTAASLADNTAGMRLAALWTPSTALLYLCGVLVGVTALAAYHWWPPRREIAFAGMSALLVGLLVVTGIVGWPVSTVAAKRVTELRYTSPAEKRHFSCGSRILSQDDVPGPLQPPQTLAATGFRCTRVAVFRGYAQRGAWTVTGSVSPLSARTPEDGEIEGKLVAALWGEVLVVASTDRLDSRANRLTGIRLGEEAPLWGYGCPKARPFGFRFAAVESGDDPAAGYITRGEDVPTVITRCGDEALAFDPATGPPR